jgi:hypothetical protein
MMRKSAFLAAAIVTGFVLVMTGAVVVFAAQANTRSHTANPAVGGSASITGVQSRDVQAQPASPRVTPELAAVIAGNVVPGARMLRAPELVNFQGAAAYEVITDLGPVYVDSGTGQVLYNGARLSFGGEEHEHDNGFEFNEAHGDD